MGESLVEFGEDSRGSEVRTWYEEIVTKWGEEVNYQGWYGRTMRPFCRYGSPRRRSFELGGPAVTMNSPRPTSLQRITRELAKLPGITVLRIDRIRILKKPPNVKTYSSLCFFRWCSSMGLASSKLWFVTDSIFTYTERKNLIESKRSWPMRYLFAGNEIIYLIQWYLLFEWPRCLWNLVTLNQLKFYSNQVNVFAWWTPLNSTSQNKTMT